MYMKVLSGQPSHICYTDLVVNNLELKSRDYILNMKPVKTHDSESSNGVSSDDESLLMKGYKSRGFCLRGGGFSTTLHKTSHFGNKLVVKST